MMANMEGYEQDLRSSNHRPKIEDINENEVEHKTDYPLGDGAQYTGQMKLINDNQSGSRVYIKHGKGTQNWQDGAKYEGDWRNGMAEGQGTFLHANGDVYTGEFYRDRAYGFGIYVHKNG